MKSCPAALFTFLTAATASAAESDALAISALIQQRHLPYNTILSPVFASPASSTLIHYSRCGDSAIWTGHYLAAESFRYAATRSPEALLNAGRAFSGIESLAEVTGTNLLARCAVPVSSPYAAAITQEEAHNGVRTGSIGGMPHFWIGDTSRDQYAGVFFGLAIAFDLIPDTAFRARISALGTRLLDFLLLNNWAVAMPDGRISTIFAGRPDQQLSFLQVGRRINPARFDSTYRNYRLAYASSVSIPISFEVLDDHNSYFKFNLASISLYNLVRMEDSSYYRWWYTNAYDILRRTTDGHGNAHFNMIDRGLKGPGAARDAETRQLLNEWLLRPRRDDWVDLRYRYPACQAADRACSPIPLVERVRTDFLWQRSPFLLYGGGAGRIETPGIDYILPYWMARYYGTIGANTPPSVVSVSPNSGSEMSQLFRFLSSDAEGATDIQLGLIVINPSLSAAGSCYLYHDRASNTVYLMNDPGTAWSAAQLGNSTVLRNSQCTLNAATSSATFNATEVALNLALTFTSVFRGNKNIFFYVQDQSGAGSGWRQIGTWNVP